MGENSQITLAITGLTNYAAQVALTLELMAEDIRKIRETLETPSLEIANKLHMLDKISGRTQQMPKLCL